MLSSSGNKVPLVKALISARDSLGMAFTVYAGDSRSEVISKEFAEAFWHMPEISISCFPEVLAGCKARGITLVIPTRDGELEFWSTHRESFSENGVAVLISSPDVIQTCIDKFEFSKFGHEQGLPFIPSYEAAELCPADRIVVKEASGSGSIGTHLDCDRQTANQVAKSLLRPLFQPFYEGIEVSVDSIVLETTGRVLISTRTRDLVIKGESKVTTVFHDESLNLLFSRIVKALGLIGPSVIQAILKDEEVHVIECNPRIGGASTASISSGLPILELAILDSWGLDSKKVVDAISFKPVRQIRAEQDFYQNDFNF